MEYLKENEELFRAWIGEKNQDVYWEKFNNGGFNISAFFFSDLLFLTRKMWLESFVLLVLALIFWNVNVPWIISIGLNVLMGYLYYPLYKNSIKRKIEKYKRKGLSYEEQLKIAKQRGGDKITIIVVLAVILEIVVVMMFSAYNVGKDIYDKTSNYSNNAITDEDIYDEISNTISEKKIYKDDKIKIEYDSSIWEDITETISGSGKVDLDNLNCVLVNKDDFNFCYGTNEKMKLDFMNEEEREKVIDYLKDACELVFKRILENYKEPEIEIKKVSEGVFFLNFKMPGVYSIFLIRQEENNDCEFYPFMLFKDYNTEIPEDVYKDVKVLIKNLEFID